MAAKGGRKVIFLKVASRLPVRNKNFVEIALTCTVSERSVSEMAAKSGGESDFCEKCQYTLDTLGVENCDEIPLSRTVKEIEANFCFSIFGKNSNIAENGRHFWGEENFFENCQE